MLLINEIKSGKNGLTIIDQDLFFSPYRFQRLQSKGLLFHLTRIGIDLCDPGTVFFDPVEYVFIDHQTAGQDDGIDMPLQDNSHGPDLFADLIDHRFVDKARLFVTLQDKIIDLFEIGSAEK